MTSHEDDTDVVGARRRGDVRAQPRARAYTGPAHGLEWTVGREGPAPWVELPLGAASCLYRLVRQRRTGWPARDQLGNYLYVPISGAAPPPEGVDGCRVLAFPTGAVLG